MKEEIIIIKKSEIKKFFNDSLKEMLNQYNSPFIKTIINSDEFIVSEDDIKVSIKNKAYVTRGFVTCLGERLASKLIDYLDEKSKLTDTDQMKGE